jgi:hypothetical protein
MEIIIVGADRNEVLNRIQTSFAREFERYGKSITKLIFHLRILEPHKLGHGLRGILRLK